ncbi:uncharacterized protein TRAVEDRAFT_158700 [Trametes versicolor FP-101664 SS1]|uniref:uncharacterized protein n=1 Tax=Trametes versicolor (strain FP-101664) TaxID=717944 RepID=UPI0004622543|nr:uncharacterized protein TRAVEDRAFT_158700 [Trametes versicolor FP-101664 SS1]EIW64437.1 hypothetical protein TRAVEDRAFT_158700 [Trametes versicolor FP-101664 SS1]
MPWRVGRDLRHLVHAAHNILERGRVSLHPICVLAKPIHSTQTQWRPALALQLNHTSAVTTGTSQDDEDDPYVGAQHVEAVLLRWKRPAGDVGAVPPEDLPPASILSLIDGVFDARPTQLPTLADLRRLPAMEELITYLRLPRRAPALVHYLLDVKEPRRALWVLRIANEVGCNFSPKFYGPVAEKLADMKKWRSILPLVRTARERLGYTTTALLNWRLHALMESQRYLSLEEVLDLFAREQVRASRLTYHLLISMHLRNHDLPSALACVRAMESAGFRVSARTWAVILTSHRSLGLTPTARTQALAALNTADGHTAVVIVNSLVQLLLDAHDMPGVVEILSLVSRPPGGPPSGPGAGTTLEGGASATVQEGYPNQSPLPLSHQVSIDISTYNLLLNYLARQGDLERALGTLQQMDVTHIHPNGDTAPALARLYFTVDCPNDALHIVADALRDFPTASALLPQLGFSPTTPAEHPTFPYTASPTIRLFNTLIWGVLQTRRLSGLRTVLRMMQITKIDPDATTLRVLLSHLYRDDCSRPREIIRVVRALMSAGLAPTTPHLHVLMAALLREQRFTMHRRGWAADDSVGEAREDPPADHLQPYSDEYSHPTAGIAFSRRYRRLLRPIIQSLTARGVRSDRASFALRIKQDGVVHRDLDKALASFRQAVESGVRPNVYHYGALMEGYTAAGDMAGAADIMREAADAGVPVDVKTHTILIAGYARHGQPSQALAAFRAMVAQGFRPDVPAIDALVSAFVRAKAFRVARRILLQLWPQIGPMADALVRAPLHELVVAFRGLHGKGKRMPERLSSGEQRMLRWKMRDLLQGWRFSLGYTRKKERAKDHVRAVSLTRTPEYTRAKRR